MAYYSIGTNVNEIVNSGQGNDTNGSITGYIGFPVSESVPDSYNFMRIPEPLGYKKNGVDLAQTSNGTSKCNAYSVFYNNTSTAIYQDVSNYNYMSCVLIGGGGGGAGGFGNYAGGGGGGAGGGGSFYRVDISSFNNLRIRCGTLGNGGSGGSNTGNGNGGGDSYIYLGNSNDYVIRANGGGGGGQRDNNSYSGGVKGNFGTNTITSGTVYNFNSSGSGGSGGPVGADFGGYGGSVGYWNTALANLKSGNGGNGGRGGNGNNVISVANSGNNYGGGGGGGGGSNNAPNGRGGANGAEGYVEIWLYKD